MNIKQPFGLMTISTWLLEMLGDPHSLTKLPEQTPSVDFKYSHIDHLLFMPSVSLTDGFLRD